MIPKTFVRLMQNIRYLKNQLTKLIDSEYYIMRKVMITISDVIDLDESPDAILVLIEEWKMNIRQQELYSTTIQVIYEQYEKQLGISIESSASDYDKIISMN